MKLYYSPGACSLVPHIVAKEAALALTLVKVDLDSKRTESGEDFKLLNSDGYVPLLLLDDGNKLSEVSAIVQYLADLAPQTRLAPPAGAFARYQLQQWLNFIAAEIHKNFSPLFNPGAAEAAKQLAKGLLLKRLHTVAEHLRKHTYLLGEQFSAADIYLFVTLSWGQYVGVDIAAWPVLARYADSIAARPAVQQALREEGLI